MAFPHHAEHHAIHRSGWLRASVLGANDGIISVTSLIMGMAASGASSHTLFITCVAGLISAGEYISVKSQEDIEKSDLAIEEKELKKYPQKELDELTQIYISRGLSKELAREVAIQLTTHDALGAHARDEIGIHENTAANPIQAALSSAASFSFGAFFPMLAILFSPEHLIMPSVLITGIAALAILGGLASYFAGTSKIKGSLRITLWGILAMAFSSWIGSLFNVTPL
jgi:VIT1/CCC1 family predicted Fe2+/Mn2+ transporter